MPPPAPIFWKKVDENQVSYFIWPYDQGQFACVEQLPATVCLKIMPVDAYNASIILKCLHTPIMLKTMPA